MTKLKSYIDKHKLLIGGVILGAIGGYLYYHFVGCNSGTCAITSRPVNSTLYGAVLGGLIGNLFKKPKPKVTDQDLLKTENNN